MRGACRIRAAIRAGCTVRGSVSGADRIGASVDKAREPIYEGAYTVTPSAQRQVLPSGHHSLVEDIIIEPIPSNYGLITWDGSTITVS